MGRAGWSVLASALVVLYAVGAAAQLGEAKEGADGPVAWTVRAVAGLPAHIHNLLTEAAKPVWYTVPEGLGMSFDEILDERCGELPAKTRAYLDSRILELNGAKSINYRAAPGKMVATPFCLKLERNVTVKVQNRDNPSKILDREYGISGPKTLEKFYNLNKDKLGFSSYTDFVKNLPEGEDVVVPYAAAKQFFVPMTTAAESPAVLVASHSTAVPAYQQGIATSMLAANVQPAATAAVPLEPDLSFVPTVRLQGGGTCRGAGDDTGASIVDIDRLRARYEAEASQQENYRNDLAQREGLNAAPYVPPPVIGIIDSGLDAVNDGFFHRTLMRANLDTANDGNNIKDDVYGFNVYTYTGNIMPHKGDPHIEHGTIMASLVLGGPEIATNWTAKLPKAPLQLKIVNLSNGPPLFGKLDATKIPVAVKYLTAQDAAIINLSLATSGDVAVFDTTYANHTDTLFVVAAGNGVAGGGVNISHYPVFPARHSRKSKHVITVGAHDLSGQLASFSNFSHEYVDLLAPGCAVPARATAGKLVRDTGTSPATAVVSFAAGLVQSLGLKGGDRIKVRILSSVDFDPALSKQTRVSGRLNIVKAIGLYHDTVETENPWPAGGADTMTFGRIMAPGELFAFCVDASGAPPAISLRKVLPNLEDSTHKKIEFWTESDGELSRAFECRQKDEDNSIGRIQVNGREVDGPALKDVRDIVMRTFRPAN